MEVYPDDELLAYVAAISRYTGAEAAAVVRLFGQIHARSFRAIHPEFFAGHSIKSFLKSVDNVIHVEVRKLHPDVVLPEFTYDDPSDNELVMHYHSPRKLCHLAEGLIDGAAKHFDVQVKRQHAVCMHDGADHCVLHLEFAEVPLFARDRLFHARAGATA